MCILSSLRIICTVRLVVLYAHVCITSISLSLSHSTRLSPNAHYFLSFVLMLLTFIFISDISFTGR